jgi:hypothetical protein
MTFDWQNATALLAVAMAAAYLARRAWLAVRRRRAGCGGCQSCPAAASTQTIVTIELKR